MSDNNIGNTYKVPSVSNNVYQVFDILEKEGYLKEAQLGQSTTNEMMSTVDGINITLNETYTRQFFGKARSEQEVLYQLKRGSLKKFNVLNYLPFQYVVEYNYVDALKYLLQYEKLPVNNITRNLIIRSIIKNYPKILYILLETIGKQKITLEFAFIEYFILEILRRFSLNRPHLGPDLLNFRRHSISPYHNVLKILYTEITKLPNLKELVIKTPNIFVPVFNAAVYHNLVQFVLFFIKNDLVPLNDSPEILASIYNSTNILQFDVSISTKEELKELLIKEMIAAPNITNALKLLYDGLGGTVNLQLETLPTMTTIDNLEIIDAVFQRRPYQQFFPKRFGSIDFIMQFIGPNLKKFSKIFINHFFEDALAIALDKYTGAIHDPVNLVILLSSINDETFYRNFPNIVKLLAFQPNIVVSLVNDKRITDLLPKVYLQMLDKIDDNYSFARQDYLQRNEVFSEITNILFKDYIIFRFDSPIYLAVKVKKIHFAEYLYDKTGQQDHPDNALIITDILKTEYTSAPLSFLQKLFKNVSLTQDDLNRFDTLIDQYQTSAYNAYQLHKLIQTVRPNKNACLIM